jgi:hypothetical protein
MKKALLLSTMLLYLINTTTLCAYGQANFKPAIFSLFELLKVDATEISRVAPHLPKNALSEAEFQQQLNNWLAQYTTEWNALQNVNGIAGKEINWESYGIPSKYVVQKQTFENVYWQWYKASAITEERKNLLFPHFPVPTSFENTPGNLAEYNGLLGMWMRLYPKEYNAFLNAPELAKLSSNGGTDKVKINYMPKFLGALVGSEFPVKKNTGNAVKDEFEYQLAIRHWYFLYEPETFEKMFGKDYDFPADFDKQHYRQSTLVKIVARENGQKGEDDYKKEHLEVVPTQGTMDWNIQNK